VVRRAGDVLLDGVQGATPSLGPARRRPERVGLDRVPRGRMNPVGDMPDRYLDLGPAGKEGLEDMATHGPMQTTDAVDRGATADGEVRHMEGLVRVVGTGPAEREEASGLDAELFLRVSAEVPLDERRRKLIEAGRHGGMRGEQVASTRNRQGHVEGLPAVC